jgi:cobalt/nickel transport system permease protein
MHIPDGYLSPQTSGAMFALSFPFLYRATAKVKESLNSRLIPLVSVFSALTFVIMMFNIPLPGGTTGHATGGAITAIVLGPWIAILAMTVSLTIQALFFGDGGILALGANIFNMGIVMPLVSVFIFRKLSSRNSIGKIKVIAAVIAGYVAINIAALFTAIELGIQPLLFNDSNGLALYFPYNLSVSIPAMMIGHLTLAGFAEAIITGLILRWIIRVQPELLVADDIKKGTEIMNRWFSIGLFFLILLTPIGLLAPGTAWGEWGREELAALGLGYIPTGFDKWSSLWRAPIPDYNLPFLDNPALVYLFSAVLGVVLTSGFFLFLSALLKKLKVH